MPIAIVNIHNLIIGKVLFAQSRIQKQSCAVGVFIRRPARGRSGEQYSEQCCSGFGRGCGGICFAPAEAHGVLQPVPRCCARRTNAPGRICWASGYATGSPWRMENSCSSGCSRVLHGRTFAGGGFPVWPEVQSGLRSLPGYVGVVCLPDGVSVCFGLPYTGSCRCVRAIACSRTGIDCDRLSTRRDCCFCDRFQRRMELRRSSFRTGRVGSVESSPYYFRRTLTQRDALNRDAQI